MRRGGRREGEREGEKEGGREGRREKGGERERGRKGEREGGRVESGKTRRVRKREVGREKMNMRLAVANSISVKQSSYAFSSNPYAVCLLSPPCPPSHITLLVPSLSPHLVSGWG